MTEQPALLWDPAPDGTVRCRLCPHRCAVAPAAQGRCGVRQNLGGVLYATNYEDLSRCDVIAVEHTPLARFRCGVRLLAIGALGESFPTELAPPGRSDGAGVETRYATAAELIDIAVEKQVAGLAYAGGEPFMWLEQWIELCEAARRERLLNVALTNGFALPEAVARVAPLLDAVNLALLGPEEVYRRRAQAERAPVLDAARALRAAGAHLEVTYLVLPGENDGEAALAEAAALASGLGAAAVHVASPLHPERAAPVKVVKAAAERLRSLFPEVHLSPMYRYG